jgi:hypothetical protein
MTMGTLVLLAVKNLNNCVGLLPMCMTRRRGRGYNGDPETGWSEPCPYCDSRAGEVIETQEIEMSDLDEMAGVSCT